MSEEIESVKKALRVMEMLASHPVTGLANQEIAQTLGLSAPNVSRIINTLAAGGWAQRLESGRFVPAIAFIGLSQRVYDALGRMEQRTTEIRQRIGAAANGKQGE